MPEKLHLGYTYVNLFPVHAILTAGRVGGYLLNIILNEPCERSKEVSTLNSNCLFQAKDRENVSTVYK